MYTFCTLFDRHYLFKGLALYESLRATCRDYRLHVLCMDDLTHAVLSRLDLANARLIKLEEFEDEQLRRVRVERSIAEYCWTCTPALISFLLERNPALDLVTYLDADLYFFGDPAPIFHEFGAASILITEHRFPSALQYLLANGIYNVQFVSFRRDVDGLECVRWWRDRCIEWCYNRNEDGKLGDQKYLDDWPVRFRGVHVLQHIGAGVAPWNVSRYRIKRRDGSIYVDGVPLIFYHFHQLRIVLGGRWIVSMLPPYTELGLPPQEIYDPYAAAIRAAIARVRQVATGFEHGFEPYLPMLMGFLARKYLPRVLRRRLRSLTRARL